MENETPEEDTPNTDAEAKVVVDTQTKTLEEVMADNARLKHHNDELVSQREKMRDEKTAATTAKLVKKEEFEKLYNDKDSELKALQLEIKAGKLDTALRLELAEAGISSVETALKLLDKDGLSLGDDSKVLGFADLVEKLKTDHSILFAVAPKAPDTIVPSADEPLGGYIEEMKSIAADPNSKLSDIDALNKKYGK